MILTMSMILKKRLEKRKKKRREGAAKRKIKKKKKGKQEESKVKDKEMWKSLCELNKEFNEIHLFFINNPFLTLAQKIV